MSGQFASKGRKAREPERVGSSAADFGGDVGGGNSRFDFTLFVEIVRLG